MHTSPPSTGSTINSASSPTGPDGQHYLAATERVALRLWENELPREQKPVATREYDTVGYVLEGSAELSMNDRTTTLKAGDSWVVPAHTRHTYRIIDKFTAVEATSPPARGRED